MTFRELREQKGFKNQLALAEASGLTQTTISQLENGTVLDPRYSTVEALSDAMGITPDVLMRAVRRRPKVAA